MKERPILFSGPMVRALLDGSKTQTRRVVKPQPVEQTGWVGGAYWGRRPARGILPADQWCIRDMLQFCPYGQPGDRLWVRETWRGVVEISAPGAPLEYGVARYVPDERYCRRVEYQATQGRDSEPWRPSIHMPRWASRITLEVTGVRVDRLQDINEDDAIAEGATPSIVGADLEHLKFRAGFQSLWDSLATPATNWQANPWVWVIKLKRITHE
ncbi:hypothetical protein HHL14_29200 [Paraburkholderia sp. G-4-1-8]|uniref:Phage-related protein n=1 Tax=Paraburkholderia antibiotica TaxID=2728839 RepID=A0A7Y0A1T7_9BURK|nr:hypothetical protein [Paraburkholderia antibiotica]